jgi:RNA polymerase sigma-70 factor (ECF subfamily)
LSDQSEHNDPLAILIRSTAEGDRSAFQSLYQKSSAKLFGTLLRILKRDELAEEVLQEVYVVIWQRAGQFESGKGRAMTWMITIARHKAIDLLRRQEEQVAKVSLDDDGAPATALEIETQLWDQSAGLSPASAMTLETCLSELEPKARDCVRLAYQYGYSREELAAKHEVPSGTLKSWLRRALKRLKDCLEQ